MKTSSSKRTVISQSSFADSPRSISQASVAIYLIPPKSTPHVCRNSAAKKSRERFTPSTVRMPHLLTHQVPILPLFPSRNVLHLPLGLGTSFPSNVEATLPKLQAWNRHRSAFPEYS